RHRVTVAEILVPVSLAITVLWPFWSFRFVVPLTPFLYLYFVKGLTVSPTLPVARVALLTAIGLNLYDHAGYVSTLRSEPQRIDWLNRFNELQTSLDWM